MIVIHLRHVLPVLFAVAPLIAQESRPTRPAESRPSIVDLRPELQRLGVPPRAQGPRPTCSVFTVAGALDVAMSRMKGAPTIVSVEFLNWAKNRAIGADHDGGFFHHILAGFEASGVCEEKKMPYGAAFDAKTTPPADAIEQASALRIAARGRLTVHWLRHWATTPGISDAEFDQIQDVLRRGWPVATGSHHSRLLVGYRLDPQQPGGGAFFTQDSAVGGYAEVSFTFVRSKIFDAFWIDLADAAPTPDSRPQSRTTQPRGHDHD